MKEIWTTHTTRIHEIMRSPCCAEKMFAIFNHEEWHPSGTTEPAHRRCRDMHPRSDATRTGDVVVHDTPVSDPWCSPITLRGPTRIFLGQARSVPAVLLASLHVCSQVSLDFSFPFTKRMGDVAQTLPSLAWGLSARYFWHCAFVPNE